MTRAAAWASAIACACACAAAGACGDNRAEPDVIDAVSGSRIAVGWYGFDDGARQADTQWLYDRAEHVRCTLQEWADHETRCVPVAERAVYRDRQCSEAVGEVNAIMKPTHFVGYDVIDDENLPARLYHAGKLVTRPSEIYLRNNGGCIGPFGASAVSYFDVIGEVDGGTLVAFHDERVGEGRLAITTTIGSDGTRLPVGLYDREVDDDCFASRRDDGSVVCAPSHATDTSLFQDPECTQAVVTAGLVVPTLARVLDPGGCHSVHAVGGEVEGPVYRREGAACVQTSIAPGLELHEVGAEVDLPALTVEPEAVAGRRLQRIVVGDGTLRWYDAQVVQDTATGESCWPVTLDNNVSWRCLPLPLTTVKMISSSSSCRGEVAVTEVMQASCERSAFAGAFSDHYEVHAIGDPVSGSLFDGSGGGCAPYVAPTGAVTHYVGPEVDAKTFVRALHYGER